MATAHLTTAARDSGAQAPRAPTAESGSGSLPPSDVDNDYVLKDRRQEKAGIHTQFMLARFTVWSLPTGIVHNLF